MIEQRVVVVGAGVLGLFTALELVRAGGVAVEVLEASHPGSGSSGRSVGMVETQYLSQPDIEVRVFGRETYTALERDHGLTFTHGGYLRLGRTERDLTRFEESVRVQADLGVKDASILGREEMSLRWPQLMTDDLIGGLFGEWDGYVDGYEVTQLLARLVKAGGGRIHSGVRLTAADRPSTWRLETTAGTFDAEVVVNAAGPWAGEVGEMLGAPVPLLPQLHGAVMIELGSPRPWMPFVMDYVPGSGMDGVYFRSERSDQLIAGLHTDEVIQEAVSPDVPLGEVSFDFIERVTTLLSNRLHDVDDMRVGRGWTGIYPMSPDHRPVAGWHRSVPGVVCALGAGGSGIQLSPAVGRLAADAVLRRHTPSFGPLVDWSHDRF